MTDQADAASPETTPTQASNREPPRHPYRAPRRAKGFGSRIARAFVVLVFAIVGAAGLFNVAATLYQLSSTQDEQARILARAVQDRLAELKRQLSALPPIASDDQRQRDAVRLLRQLPSIAEVTFVTTTGREEATLSRLGSGPSATGAVLMSDSLLEGLQAGELRTGPVYVQGDSEPRLRVAYALPTDIAIATIDLRTIWGAVTMERVGRSGTAFLAERTGRLLAHPDEAMVLRGADLPQASVRRSAPGEPKPPWLTSAFDGTAVLRTVGEVSGTDWLVVIDFPLFEAIRMLQTVLAGALVQLVLGTGLATLLGTLTSRRLLGPVRELQGAAERLGAGDLSARVTLSPDDEIGELGSHFNVMADHVQAAHDTLEQQVTARTAALSQALDELQRTQDRAIQVERLATLGRLATGVAHELKNPLNFVTNFADLSVDLADELKQAGGSGTTSTGEADETLELLKGNLAKIRSHARRADTVVQNLLQHASRVGEARRQDVSIGDVIRDVVRTMAARWNAIGLAIEVETGFEAGIGIVDGYPQELAKCIENVLDNAAYALRLRLDQEETFRPRIAIRTEMQSDWMSLTIRDNGPGMAENLVGRAVEPFFTTRPAGSGVGLGLSLCEDVVTRLHGGRMSIASRPGEFFEVAMLLPQAGPPPGP